MQGAEADLKGHLMRKDPTDWTGPEEQKTQGRAEVLGEFSDLSCQEICHLDAEALDCFEVSYDYFVRSCSEDEVQVQGWVLSRGHGIR